MALLTGAYDEFTQLEPYWIKYKRSMPNFSA
jgi:hypothetical protein